MSSAAATAAPARTKSPEAFRTISEVSAELDVPQHVLRFWETRFTQIRPVKRAGGRRFYRPDDVSLLRGIRSLLYSDGYTIKGVQKVLRDKGWRSVAEIGRNTQAEAPWREPNGAAATHVEFAGEDIADTGSVDDELEAPQTPEFFRTDAAMATLLRTHVEASETAECMAIEEHKRVKLELLLAELLVLRDRLLAARSVE